MMTPTQKMTHSAIMAYRRPRASAVLHEIVSVRNMDADEQHSRCTQESACEGSDGEKSDNETLTNSAEGTCAGNSRCGTFAKTEEEIVHEKNIGNLSGIVTEDEASH